MILFIIAFFLIGFMLGKVGAENPAFARMGTIFGTGASTHVVIPHRTADLTQTWVKLRQATEVMRTRLNLTPGLKHCLLSLDHVEKRTETKMAEVTREFNPRQKRQVLVGVLGLVTGFLGSMALGATELENLRNAVETLQENQDKAIMVLQQHETALAHHDAQLHKLNASVEMLATQMIRTMAQTNNLERFLILKSTWEALESKIADYLHALHAARQGKVTEFALPRISATKVIDKMKEWAEPQGFWLMSDDPEWLYQLKASYIVASYGFGLVIHVPMVRHEQVFSLFALRPEPWVGPGTGQLVTPRVSKKYLGVSQDEARIVELSEEEFHYCYNFIDIWFCPRNLVVWKNPEQSCLYVLWANKWNLVESQCDFAVEAPRTVVWRLSQNTFGAYFVGKETVDIACPGEPIRTSRETAFFWSAV